MNCISCDQNFKTKVCHSLLIDIFGILSKKIYFLIFGLLVVMINICNFKVNILNYN